MLEAQQACFAVFDSYSLLDLTSDRGGELRTLLNVPAAESEARA